MKKLLALVLALVMTLSLCVVSSNAKFDDAADISYTEAADVMQAVGVFVGDGSGNFYPTQNLTRAQACKVIAYLDLGESVAEALPAVQMFSDVPATHWAAKYIAYCADAEIVAGVGGGKFDPEAQVTGYQFAKMLLVVLGYDVEIEKLTGMNWSISTAKLVKENKLSKGFKGSMNNGLTREEAAQIAFRAIQAKVVTTYEGYGLKVNANNEIVNSKNGKAVQPGMTLAYKLWHDFENGDLSSTDTFDKLGNPATKWVWKNAKVGTYAATPVLTYTTEWTWAQAKEDLAELGVEIDTVDNNYTQEVVCKTNGVTVDTLYPTNNKEMYTGKAGFDPENTTLKEAIKDNTKQCGNGVVTKFYANGDDYLKLVAVASYELAQVTSVDKDLASTKLVNEAKLHLNLFATADETDTVYADEDTIGFGDVYADAEVDDFFLVAVQYPVEKGSSEKFVASIVAPVVKEGKLTSNGTKSCKLDGELYNKAALAQREFATDSTNALKLFCDEYGYAYGTDLLASSSKLVVVTDLYTTLEKGKLVSMVDVVYADGTTGSLKVGLDVESDYSKTVGGVFDYGEADTKGVYTLKEAKVSPVTVGEKQKIEEIKAGAAKFNGKYFADGVKTIFFYAKNGKDFTDGVKTVVVDGVAKVDPKTTAKVTYDLNGKDKINALFVNMKPSNAAAGTDGIVFIADSTRSFKSYDKDDKTVTVMAYTAYVNGKEIEEFYVQDGGDGAVGKFYELEDDVDLENGYLLTTKYVGDPDTDDIFADSITVNYAALDKKFNSIDCGEYGALNVAKAVFVDVCDTDGVDVEGFSSLKEALYNNGKSAELFIIYDDTDAALYVYVGLIAARG